MISFSKKRDDLAEALSVSILISSKQGDGLAYGLSV